MLDPGLTLAVIGSGTMGEAIIRGLLASGKLKPTQIIATDRRSEVLAALHTKHGVATTTHNPEAVHAASGQHHPCPACSH